MSYIKLIYKYQIKKFPSADDAVFMFFDALQPEFSDLVPVYESDQHLSCIIKQDDLKKFREQISFYRDFEFTSSEIIENTNWMERCQELWQELKIGNLTITQIADPDTCTITPTENQILIQPGTGFGTGHHACTAMLVELIQEQEDLKGKLKHTLDFGTGSGILAFVLAKYFKAEVLAVDNDSLALENTKTNKKLNAEIADLITISEDCNIQPEKTYDLIVANIYSSLLVEMKNQFHSALPKLGRLLISGILNEQINEILEAYQSNNWEILKQLNKTDDYGNVWHALVLAKI
jgi:ribosomal protein L11 methyltransferase